MVDQTGEGDGKMNEYGEMSMQEANEIAVRNAALRATPAGAAVAAEYDRAMTEIDAEYESTHNQEACDEAVARTQAVYDAAMIEAANV